MAAPFYGAPTRVGRIILAVLGAPFVLAAVVLLGGVIFGDEEPGGKLVMVIAALVMAIAGFWLWAPAFPGVVNRLLETDNRLFKRIRPHAATWASGVMVAAMGLVPVLSALGVAPSDEASSGAPRWIGGIAGGLFVVAGLYILTKPAVDRLEPGLRKQILGLFPLLIVTGMATISSWIAFGPGERRFESGASNSILQISWGDAGELLGRAAFGVGAVFLIVITAIGWWKYLRGRW